MPTRDEWKARALAAEAKNVTLQDALDECRKGQTPPPPPPPPPPAATGKGVATPGGLQNWSATDRARYLDLMKAAGAGWIRVGFYAEWPTPGVTLAQEIRARGMKALGVLVKNDWIGMGPMEMAAFAGQMVNNADAFEVWNEQNISNFWRTPDPVKYAGVYNAAKNAIKAKRPEVTVVSGGLSPAPDSPPNTIDPGTFLTQAINAGMKPEAIGWHPYCNPALPGQNLAWSTWFKMTSHPTWGKYPVWITEFGAPTYVNGVSPSFQAQSISEAFRLWKSYGLTTPLFVYEGRDGGTDPNNGQHHYGMLNYDWSRKPAYDTFKGITA